MSEWTDVAPEDEIAPGAWRSVDLDGTEVAVFNLDGAWYAIENVCTHDGGILTGGAIEGDVIICPRHGAQFSIRTGEVLAPPAYEDVPTFPVRVHGGIVQVRDPRWD
jgi:3-phenylpropionate/trans-cinnamate dioxygenase ferredoxin component